MLQESDGELEEGEREATDDESSDGELHDVCGFIFMLCVKILDLQCHMSLYEGRNS